MALVDPSASQTPVDPPPAERLDSWKEIAAYLKRDESTVRRWEDEGLPVHRLPHKKKATVYAFKSELDVWWSDGRSRLDAAVPVGAEARTVTTEPSPKGSRAPLRWVAAGVMVLLAGALALAVAERQRVFGGPRAGEIASIAVLPLKNLSGDPEQDYFADGMTEALITELGKISALQVLSHQSVSGYGQTTKPLPEIARELKVNALLEGTVLHSGTRVRVTANLVQAAPERHLWAESYEFDRQDVLAIQGEVARNVASRIRINVTPQERARLTPGRRVDPDAYEAYLLGRAYQSKGQGARARVYFEKSIQKDPNYAPAYASLAQLSLQARVGPRTPLEARMNARYWATMALRVDDTLAEAHSVLARAAQQEWDWATAEREYRRAIELNPNSFVARIWYTMYLDAMQRFDEALVQAQRAQQLDPGSPLNDWAAATYVYAGRTEEGMALARRVLELNPAADAGLVIARTYVTQGKYASAIEELRRALAVKPRRDALTLGALAHAYARAGDREEALKLVDELKRFSNPVTPFALIWAYAGLGDNDQAFMWLEKAFMERRDRMTWLNVDPLLDPLRADPRFDELVRRVGLPTKGLPRETR
jgi:TolB-like protein